MLIRGKWVHLRKHAVEGMNAERPPFSEHDLIEAFETPDEDDGNRLLKRLGGRTLIIYYREEEETLDVRSVSGTRRRLVP